LQNIIRFILGSQECGVLPGSQFVIVPRLGEKMSRKHGIVCSIWFGIDLYLPQPSRQYMGWWTVSIPFVSYA